jgi:hypothetical protein
MSKVAQIVLQKVEQFMDEWSENIRTWDDYELYSNFMRKLQQLAALVVGCRWTSVPLNEVYHFVHSRKELLTITEGSQETATFIHTFHADLRSLVKELTDFEEQERL